MPLRLGEAVTRLELDSDGMRAWTASEASYDGATCVIAVPATVLGAETNVDRLGDGERWSRHSIRYSILPPAELTAAFAERVGPLAFAGEHIGGAFNGLMEGAIRSDRTATATRAPRERRRSRPRRPPRVLRPRPPPGSACGRGRRG